MALYLPPSATFRLHPDHAFEKHAIKLLKKRNKGEGKKSVVFDIDQTAFLYEIDICHPTEGCIRQRFPEAQINKEIFKVYQYCLDNDILVFFVTARLTRARDKTLIDLIRLGYGTMEGLFLRPELDEYNGKSGIALYKSNIRKYLNEQGYDILVNFGDTWQDIMGGYSQHHVKLPEIPRFVSRAKKIVDISPIDETENRTILQQSVLSFSPADITSFSPI